MQRASEQTTTSKRGWRSAAPGGAIATIWRHRDLLWKTSLAELHGNYAGSLIGLAWLVLGPMVLLSLYASIYIVIFRVRPVALTQATYVLYIFSGLTPLLGFTGALAAGTMSLSANRQILLNTVFPAELIPLREVLTNSAALIVSLCLVCVLDAFVGRLSLLTLLVPALFVLQIMFVTGLVWILSLVNLVVRDVQMALNYVNLILLISSPIAYTPDMIPRALAPLVWLNPVAYFVMSYQRLIVMDALPSWHLLAGAVAFALASFFGGHYLFRRAKRVMVDYA